MGYRTKGNQNSRYHRRESTKVVRTHSENAQKQGNKTDLQYQKRKETRKRPAPKKRAKKGLSGQQIEEVSIGMRQNDKNRNK